MGKKKKKNLLTFHNIRYIKARDRTGGTLGGDIVDEKDNDSWMVVESE
jgi:hypothetical protein